MSPYRPAHRQAPEAPAPAPPEVPEWERRSDELLRRAREIDVFVAMSAICMGVLTIGIIAMAVYQNGLEP